LSGGMWPLLRSLPFRDIADPEIVPPAIIANLDNLDPFHPMPELYLNGSGESFFLGLQALRKLSKVVQVTSCSGNGLSQEVQKLISHTISGPYPAHDPGVFLYHTRTSAEKNQSWFISGPDVQDLGRFLQSGVYPTERCLAVSSPTQTGHIRTRLGVPISRLIPKTAPEFTDAGNLRILAGGIWQGQTVGLESYLGMYETSLMALPVGGQSELFGFARPGWKKPSRSRAFLSFLNQGPLAMDTGQHGEERACINCGSCAKVCPVDILPQFTLKSILADEVEESLAHGLLDCVECGLCSYVCPAKIELAHQLKRARSDYYREKTG
jgi:Na+-transporting NADH:ubiquinone oxidoreductase subunit A